VSATVPVAPGEELRGEVGEAGEASMALYGAPACAGGAGHGWYDGGAGDMGSGGLPGGGSSGGGASWVTAVAGAFPCCLNVHPWGGGRLLLVAGGGGGGGYASGASGGDAGAVGHAGSAAAGLGGRGGAGGGSTGGGAGGAGATGGECKGSGGNGWGGESQGGGEGGFGESGEVQAIGPAGGGGGGGGHFGGGGGGGGAHYESFQPEAQTCLGGGGGGGGSSFLEAGPLIAEPTEEPARVTLSYEVLPPPQIVFATPADNAVYEQGQPVPVSYLCADSAGAPGTEACEAESWHFGSSGLQAAHISSGGDLPTAELGSYRLFGTAKSRDGLKANVFRDYTVIAPAAPRIRPLISGVSETHARWRVGGHLAALVARSVPIGTRFAFSLNEAAVVHASFARHTHGHSRSAGAFALHASSGSCAIAFDGRVSKHTRLPPGSYTVTLTAVNTAGESSTPRSLAFTVVR
jgi:hypothetical protein